MSTARTPSADPDLAAVPAGAGGLLCGVAVESLRDLGACVAEYAPLFDGVPWDAAMLMTVALPSAFCSPWLAPERLHTTNRVILWGLRADWEIDYVARSRREAAETVRRCLSAAEEGWRAPDDALARFLIDLRTTLETSSSYEKLRPLWTDELRRALHAMLREWEWRSLAAAGNAAELPDLEDYLGNRDNTVLAFIALTHWIAADEPGLVDRIEPLMTAAYAAQGPTRLLNDLATDRRDRAWGDLNALRLPGVSRSDVVRRARELSADCERLLRPLLAEGLPQAVFLDRYLAYFRNFHRVTDAYAPGLADPDR